MAHFAELGPFVGDQAPVLRVTPIANERLLDEQGQEQEALGEAFVRRILGGTWKQTSYSGSTRKNYAGVGFVYDRVRDAFIPPKPSFPSWVLNEETCRWDPPIPQPSSGGPWEWDEVEGAWVDASGAAPSTKWVVESLTGTEIERVNASADPNVRGFMNQLYSTSRVRPKHPAVSRGVNYLEQAGLLDYVGRAAEILA